MTPDETWIAETPAPTVCQQILAHRLRSRRLELGMKISDVAARLRFSSSKISRLETEERIAQVEDVHTLAGLYGFSGAETAELVQLAIGARQRSPFKDFHPASPERDYLELEVVARRVRAFDPNLVHGLLQLPSYTSEVLHGRGILEHQRILDSRAVRQRRLTGVSPLPIEFVVGEAALRMNTQDPTVMQDQIAHLLAVSTWPNVVLQVLPSSAGPAMGRLEGFNILESGKEGLADVVYVELLTRQLIIDERDQVSRYEDAFQSLSKQALTSEESRDFLESIQRQ
ncbi:helix-turn-helix domain-containing protein [Kineosporia sp. J2-2]|uniref:Helix-turn-helix domain-containing protein n=1 Tax=Kineosporia corallincola TaxID=2835133 RepID=A0ABS5TPA5_9ACTN|nr:helix-turn-helix transcriptional regulator [Kineosporia corallincola]MBT0772937.1 helix-turn-helix domain-containing protein [Kineosporia corallincola]